MSYNINCSKCKLSMGKNLMPYHRFRNSNLLFYGNYGSNYGNCLFKSEKDLEMNYLCNSCFDFLFNTGILFYHGNMNNVETVVDFSLNKYSTEYLQLLIIECKDINKLSYIRMKLYQDELKKRKIVDV